MATIEIDISEKKIWEIVKDLPARLFRLIWKTISRKGIILILTVWLIKTDTFPAASEPYIFGFIVLLVLFGIEGLKFLKDLKK